jgi:hypothetical protein
VTKPKTRGECAFCPFVGVLTKEDALPQWIGRLVHVHMPPKGRWESIQVAMRPDAPDHQHTRIVGNPSSKKLRIACGANCNNGWMSRLETAVRPHLEPMILDRPMAIDAAGQTCLATWLTKTALVHELAAPGTAVATSYDRRWFGEHQYPPPGSQMWLARFEGELGSVFYSRRTMTLAKSDDPTFQLQAYAQLFTLLIGHVVLQAMIPKQPQVAYPQRKKQPFSVQFWPPSTSVNWPPVETLTDESLVKFTKV